MPRSTNFELARLFELTADLLELEEENPFRIRAYRRAAQSLQALTEDVEVVARENRLEAIAGIGADLAGKIREYLSSGRVGDIEALRARIPASVVELLQVPGVGPKTAKQLYEHEGVTSVARLEELARAGKLRGRKGIQARTEENILKGIALLRAGRGRMRLGEALALGEELVATLAGLPAVQRVSLAGSVRRMKETIGDLDLLATSTRPAAVMRRFTELPQVAEVLEHGPTKATVRHRDGIQIDLRVVEPACFGAALAYFTGSKQHNIHLREMALKRGLKISEYGVFRARTGRRIAGAAEEDVYAAVGLPWVPPELREDTGEIEAALEGALPDLIDVKHVRGDLHCHTNASDGRHPVEAVVVAAERRGYDYVAITDHSRSARVAGGLSAAEMVAHIRRIRAVQRRHPGITVLAGCECDVLPDGSLDYPVHVLEQLDLVIAAVHGTFKAPKAQMTARLVRALESPYVNVLAHPTGRLIGARAPYELDIDAVLRAARRLGKAVEVNGDPGRLDLSDVHARRAHELGVPVAIGTDTHLLTHLDNMRLGVATARRGWTERAQVVNAWPAKRLLAWVHEARSTGRGRPRRRA